MTFEIERLVLMLQYAIWAGLALFVGTWWGITALKNMLRYRKMQQVDWLMLGISIMALATFVSRILWLPNHYFHGIGQPAAAIKWSNGIAPFLATTNVFIIVGLILHVKTAWVYGSRGFIVVLMAVWMLLMALAWWMAGGFGFIYV